MDSPPKNYNLGSSINRSVQGVRPVRLTILLLVLLLTASCRQQDSMPTPVPSQTPVDLAVSTPMPLDAPLAQIVQLGQSQSGLAQAKVWPHQSVKDTLPAPLTRDSTYLDGTNVTAELVDYINSLNRLPGQEWPTQSIEDLNRNLPETTALAVTVSNPIRLGDGRHYTLMEWFDVSGDEPEVKRVGVLSYVVDNGQLKQPGWDVLLSASSVVPQSTQLQD